MNDRMRPAERRAMRAGLADASAAMLRAAEAASEAAEIVRALARSWAAESSALERVARRLENGAAVAELDRRIVDELAREPIDEGPI